jgi:hypothetical protein
MDHQLLQPSDWSNSSSKGSGAGVWLPFRSRGCQRKRPSRLSNAQYPFAGLGPMASSGEVQHNQ